MELERAVVTVDTAIPRRFIAQRERVLRILARWEQPSSPVQTLAASRTACEC